LDFVGGFLARRSFVGVLLLPAGKGKKKKGCSGKLKIPVKKKIKLEKPSFFFFF
jgi:hypothetical protein